MYKTKFIGKPFIKLETINSTNEYLDVLSQKKSIAEGTVVSSNLQTDGKGQNNNKWESKKRKNILLSCYLDTSFVNLQEIFYINIATSLSIIDFLKEHITFPYIKWPNDILVKNKKISGILITNRIQGKKLISSIVGVGININQKKFKTTNKATSLSLILNKKKKIDSEIQKFLFYLESRYLQIKNGDRKKIKQEYIKQLYMINQNCYFKINNKKTKGNIQGISDQGELLVQIKNKIKKYNFNEIQQEY